MKLFKTTYVWLDTLPDVNEETQFVPVVERYTYCCRYEQLQVLEELLIPYALRMNDVVSALPHPTYHAVIDLKLPKDEHVAVDLRPYGYERIFYLMTQRKFRAFHNNQAIILAEDCMVL